MDKLMTNPVDGICRLDYSRFFGLHFKRIAFLVFISLSCAVQIHGEAKCEAIVNGSGDNVTMTCPLNVNMSLGKLACQNNIFKKFYYGSNTTYDLSFNNTIIKFTVTDNSDHYKCGYAHNNKFIWVCEFNLTFDDRSPTIESCEISDMMMTCELKEKTFNNTCMSKDTLSYKRAMNLVNISTCDRNISQETGKRLIIKFTSGGNQCEVTCPKANDVCSVSSPSYEPHKETTTLTPNRITTASMATWTDSEHPISTNSLITAGKISMKPYLTGSTVFSINNSITTGKINTKLSSTESSVFATNYPSTTGKESTMGSTIFYILCGVMLLLLAMVFGLCFCLYSDKKNRQKAEYSVYSHSLNDVKVTSLDIHNTDVASTSNGISDTALPMEIHNNNSKVNDADTQEGWEENIVYEAYTPNEGDYAEVDKDSENNDDMEEQYSALVETDKESDML